MVKEVVKVLLKVMGVWKVVKGLSPDSSSRVRKQAEEQAERAKKARAQVYPTF